MRQRGELDQAKILINCFVQYAVSTLMLPFAAESVCGPRDNQPARRIAEADRTLGSTMTERCFGRPASKSVRDCGCSVAIRIANDSQPKVDHMLQRLIKLVFTMA